MNTPKYTPPSDALVADMVNRLDADLRCDFEERAGIMTHEAGLLLAHAECLALLDVLRRHHEALSGIWGLQIELNGSTEWLLTTHLAGARQYLLAIGATEISVVTPREIIDNQYGGVGVMTTLG